MTRINNATRGTATGNVLLVETSEVENPSDTVKCLGAFVVFDSTGNADTFVAAVKAHARLG